MGRFCMKKDRFDELSEIWIEKAKDDHAWARASFEDGYYGGVCFLGQQVAEKALKAYFFYKREKLVRTHDLERLLEKAETHEKSFSKLRSNCQILNTYYTDTRYPEIWDYTRFENKKLADEALKLAKEVLEFVSERIE